MNKNKAFLELEKLDFEIRNMGGYFLKWEWMEEAKDGEFLRREDVLSLIESKIKACKTKTDHT